VKQWRWRTEGLKDQCGSKGYGLVTYERGEFCIRKELNERWRRLKQRRQLPPYFVSVSPAESRQCIVFPPHRLKFFVGSTCSRWAVFWLTLYNVIQCWLTTISHRYHNIGRCLRHSRWFSLVAVVRRINCFNKLLSATIIWNMYGHPRLLGEEFFEVTWMIYVPQKIDRNSLNFLFCLRV
jgi:hypothetical protein